MSLPDLWSLYYERPQGQELEMELWSQNKLNVTVEVEVEECIELFKLIY